MGPTNVALVKLFRANEALREAQDRLNAASKNVRVQERKVNDLAERVKLAHSQLRELQSKGGQLELDVKTREARIEKLRLQQQNTTNNREYQVFLLEIGAEKVDRGKSEDELLNVMQSIENGQAALKELTDQQNAENEKLTALRNQIGQALTKLQAEVDALKPARDEAAAAIPPRILQTFERLAERYEGEALSALAKPDRRREEYLCGGCHLNLVADVYNRLHTRDELISCTSCGRILYIPEDLPPEVAINSRGKTESPKEGSYGAAAPKSKRAPKVVERLDPADRRAKGKLGDLLAKAQGESMRIAADAGLKGVECDVIVNGKPQGTYKGKTGEHLQRIISLQMEEKGVKGAVEVREKTPSAAAETSDATTTHEPSAVESAPAELQTQAAVGSSTEQENVGGT
jgi:predicted  nucleic acid-binding Zn-ribbon protein